MVDISFKSFLTETTSEYDTFDMKRVVIAPGRYNPPHRGHSRIIEQLQTQCEALDATPVIVVIDSGKYDSRNPLDGNTRVELLEKIYPNIEKIVSQNAYGAMLEMQKRKMLPVCGVTGTDRKAAYKQVVGSVFGESIGEQFVSDSLYRDPDSEELVGISGTKVREAVMNGERCKFRTMVDFDTDDANDLFERLREVLSNGY